MLRDVRVGLGDSLFFLVGEFEGGGAAFDGLGVYADPVARVECGEYHATAPLAEGRLRGSVQGIGVVRFNPFVSGQGGNQSFAAAFLDERGNGVVFSTLYSRDRVGVYAKPVENGASSFELTGEEKEAITKAKESVAKNKK